MSDSEDSTVTCTEVSSPFEELPDIGSPRVVVYGYDGLPMHPPSPDYVSGPEEPKQAPPSPVYVPYEPELVYPDFMPPEDEVLLAEEQPLLATLLPAANSPRYITDSNPEEDPEEDPTDYPVDKGDDDDDDDDDDESSNDNEDDDDVEEDEDEEEEEHLALADSVPPPVHRVTARMFVRAQTPISLPSDTEVARLLAIPTPPLSPLSPLPTYPLGYRATMIWLRAETPSTSHPLPSSTPPSGTPPLLPIHLPTPSPPMLHPSTNCRAGVSEVTLPPQKRLCIALGPRYEVDTWDEMVEDMQRILAATDVAGLSQRMTDFVTTVRQDTDEIYVRLDDA
ncbi:hypothetical protein Tco_0184179 [Tanacetum coccineum]